MRTIFTDLKTTVAGMVVLGLVGGFLLGRVDAGQMMALVGIAAGGGLLMAKDGGTK